MAWVHLSQAINWSQIRGWRHKQASHKFNKECKNTEDPLYLYLQKHTVVIEQDTELEDVGNIVIK